MTFPSSVLSLGVSKDDEFLVAGMVDGLVSIQRMEEEEKAEDQAEEDESPNKQKWEEWRENVVDEVVPEYEAPTLAKYNAWFRKFEYSKALDQVLLPYVVNKNPQVTVSVIQELIRRKGLQRALSHRTHKSLAAIIRFLCRYISDYRFTQTLIDATQVLIDSYEDQFEELLLSDVGKLLATLLGKLKQEVKLTYDCLGVSGAIDMLIANAGDQEDADDLSGEQSCSGDFDRSAPLDLEQSEEAKRHGTINVY